MHVFINDGMSAHLFCIRLNVAQLHLVQKLLLNDLMLLRSKAFSRLFLGFKMFEGLCVCGLSYNEKTQKHLLSVFHYLPMTEHFRQIAVVTLYGLHLDFEFGFCTLLVSSFLLVELGTNVVSDSICVYFSQ